MMENKNQKGAKPTPKKGPNKGTPKKQFNFYWIYAIIGILLIGLPMFQMGGGERKTTWDKFVTDMLQTGEVDRLIIVTTGTESRAEIYIKPDALSQDKYKGVKETAKVD